MSVKRMMLVGLIGLCVLLLAGTSFAQGSATPIQIGQNAPGTLSADISTAQFALTANAGDSAVIQVLALSAGFMPRFSVLSPAGVEILTVDNADGKATLTGNASFGDAGVYTIVVSGENGSTGQFVLSLQAGAPPPPPTPLTLDQPVTATVGSQTPVQVYRFDTSSLGAVAVIVRSQTADAGALVTLYDEGAGKTIASSDSGVVSVAYQLPANGSTYRVEVRAAGSGDTAFSICVGTCGSGLQAGNGNPSPTPAIDVAASPVPQAAACSASSSVGGSANLRSGPGTNYAIISSLPVGQMAQVLGEWTGGGWYEVSFNGQTVWVGGSVVSLIGDCSALPQLSAPTNAPLAPTKAPNNPQPPVSTPEVGSGDNNGNNGGNTTQNLPDLTTTNLQITVDQSGNYSATVTILNNGTAPITPDMTFTVLVCVDSSDNCNEVDSQSISLQPGATITLSYLLPSFTPGGDQTVTLTLDSNHEIKESDESNNDAFGSFSS